MIGWLIVVLIAFLACCILHACDQPGHRRRRTDLKYEGPERRANSKHVDFLQRPAFRRKLRAVCDKLKLTEYPPEEYDEDLPAIYRDNK